jgi:pyruvate/2-oxoglutarate dehydrogenase complex dihydrolipoamide acyltransferase (E2) component
MGPDPFAIYSEKNLTNTAEENTRLLDAATRARARQEAAAIANESQRVTDAKIAMLEDRNTINNLFANNPDIQADQEGFGAAMARAQIRASSRGIDLDSPGLVREALAIYRKDHERPASESAPPVLEGVSNADTGGIPKPKPAEQPKGKSLYERFYGKGPADELHEEEIDQEKMLFDYADGKNEYLEKMGVPLQFSEIRQTQEGNMERSARKAQRGAS